MPHLSVTAAETPQKPAYIMAKLWGGRHIRRVGRAQQSGRSSVSSLWCWPRRSCSHDAGQLSGVPRSRGCCHAESGVIFTPISTHLKKDETAYILENCGAKLFIAFFESSRGSQDDGV